ncbi:hypothetical protein ACFL6C_00600 [Myxococcota bacterium]
MRAQQRDTRVVAVLCLFVWSCSAGTGNGNGDADIPDDSDAAVGAFQVKVVAATTTPGYTSVFGKVFDGSTPQPLVWEETATVGDCELLVPRAPFCGEPCEGGSICVEDDECQGYPDALSVGTVVVQGIETASGATEFSMDPIANNYQPAVSLAYPAFSEGDAIEFDPAGTAAFAAFTLNAKGIEELDLVNDSIQVEHGLAINLEWVGPGQSGISEIHVKLDISHHGGPKGKIECLTEDTGSLQLTAGMLGQLLDLGYAGFPTIIVTRQSTGSATTAVGRVDLVVSSGAEKEVLIPGLISCNEDGDCPTGQTCLLSDRYCI